MILNYKPTEEELLSSFQGIRVSSEEYQRALIRIGEAHPNMTLSELAEKLDKNVLWVLKRLWFLPTPARELVNAAHICPSRTRGWRVACCDGHDTLGVGDTGAILERPEGNVFFRNTDQTFHNICVDGNYITLEPM